MNAWLLASGLAAGALHVLAGPDHLAAVAPLAVIGSGRAWIAGLRWGLGHASGVLVVAAAALFLREQLPLEALSRAGERLVGVALASIGLWGFYRFARTRVHTHEHQHAGVRHAHVHAHSHEHSHGGARRHEHGHAAFAMGLLHGTAGGSHLLGILPALALPSRTEATLYAGAFGVGTIAAMAVFSLVVGGAARRLEPRGRRYFSLACSTCALLLGCAWLAAAGRL